MHQRIRLSIPDGLSFSDLHPAREPGVGVSFARDVIAGILHASGLSVERVAEDLIAEVIIDHGGTGWPDPEPSARTSLTARGSRP